MPIIIIIYCTQWWDSNFSSAGSITEVIYYQPVLFQLMVKV